ncbi:MAG TPA: hypothetical protein VMD53_17980 [Rhizomicrobium sp.]|nr:hypothetical protein [Rhizomicrobium sp.]
MMAKLSRVSHRPGIIVAAMIAMRGLAPTAAHAQSDQTIVLICTYNPNPAAFRYSFTIDLQGKTVVEENITSPGPQPYQGTVTQITDQQITWIDHPIGSSSTYILNRYTGQLVTRVTDGPPEAIGRVVEYTCQKQQKQF